ncbi:MAG: glycosyltransferase family 2 protein [Planctomycetes bacterium]|nr:glycosyltransferase family 2 protein [Planctomycetota bacterium]
MARVPVTIVIPTLDGGLLFERALAALVLAEPRPESILVVDSGSQDGTPERAAAAGAEVLRVPRAEFDHGATRQMAAARAATEFVAFLSQDAVPEPDYLGPLVRAFSDARVAGASARILPHPDSSPLARRTVLSSRMASAQSRVIAVPPEQFATSSGRARCDLLLFDNVASLLRRDLLMRWPFPRTMMGEDAAFAAAALLHGHRLAFVAQSVVRHAHEHGPLSAFRRYRDDARFQRRAFDVAVRASLRDTLRGLAYELCEDARGLRGEPLGARAGALLRAPLLRSCQVLGQWWGSRAEALP